MIKLGRRNYASQTSAPETVPVPPYFPDNDVIRHDLAVNYSNLKRLDDQIGEIVADLKEDGLYENSIIFFYGDHGGPFPRHKRALYETGTKVPLIIKFPKNNNRGSRDDRLISFIDLQKDDDKKVTQVTIILPQSYSDESLENVPWLE